MIFRRTLSGAGAAALAVVAGALVSSSLAAAADEPAATSLAEDYTHPGAEAILRQYDLKVFQGDGRIMFDQRRTQSEGQCPVGRIQVEKLIDTAPWGYYYCFSSTGTRGYLTLEVPGTFGVRGGSVPLEATAQLPDGDKTYQIAPNQPVAIDPGSGDEMPQAVLVKLELTGA